MMRNDGVMQRDEVGFDPDYCVIDEPPAVAVPAREPMDYRVVREQMLEVIIPSGPQFQIYWTVPLDIEWADE